MAKIKIDCRINGEDVSFEAYPMARLLDVIREVEYFTGTKEGCGEGECGACSIFVNGRMINSCLVPAIQMQGAEIITIEGIANGEELQAVQKGFLQKGGAQCGICTPGMIVAAVNLLNNDPDPSADDIKNGLAGNLCRCTGYIKIFESVVKAVQDTRSEPKKAGAL
jgi:carbon-monoxide dehydrogenase small subunit